MENKFLANNHHNLFQGKNLNYKIFLCKDCTKKKKEYIQQDTDHKPCEILNLGYIGISCGRYPILITTPTMVAPFGFNSQSLNLALQFTNIKEDAEMRSFYDFIQELELRQMQFIGLTEDTADLYLTQIKHHKEDKYDPNLLVKVPFLHKSNSYDVNIKHKDSSVAVTNIFKFSKLKCDIYIDNIWFFNGKYVCKWKVKNILIL